MKEQIGRHVKKRERKFLEGKPKKGPIGGPKNDLQNLGDLMEEKTARQGESVVEKNDQNQIEISEQKTNVETAGDAVKINIVETQGEAVTPDLNKISTDFKDLGAAARKRKPNEFTDKQEIFEKIKEIKEIKSAILAYYDKNESLKRKSTPEDFEDETLNKLLRFWKPIEGSESSPQEIFLEKLLGKARQGQFNIEPEDIEELQKHVSAAAFSAEEKLLKKSRKKGIEVSVAKKKPELKKEDEALGEPVINNNPEISPEANENPEFLKIRNDLEAKLKIEETELEKIKKEGKDKNSISAKEALIKELKEDIADPQGKMMRDALGNARNEFADTEYRQRNMLQTIGKYFNNKFSKEKDKYETPDIKYRREEYERSLKVYKDHQIDKLKGKNLSGEELEAEVKKIYSFYNVDEATKYYDAKTQAKMSYLAENKNKSGEEKNRTEKTWDFVRLKSMKISEWYNKKVPPVVKFGLIAASFAPGASAFVLGKRTWGAFMTVAAGGMQLDKIAQFKDVMADKLERNKAYKEIAGNPEQKVDFDKLSGLLDGKIGGIDKKINDRNFRSGVNKFIAFTGAAFLGYSTYKGIVDLIEHGQAISSTEIIRKLISSKAEVPVAAGLADAAAHKMPSSAENLTINKGSSIEKTLIEYYKNHKLPFKDNGYAAHRAYLDYMDEYIKDHKDELVKSGKLAEYQKMLKDGMVNVKPGTKMIIDPHTGHIVSIDGKLSHLNVRHHVGGAPSHAAPVDNAPEALGTKPVPEAVQYNPGHDYGQDRLKVMEEIDKLKGDYRKALDEMGVDLKPEGVEHKLAVEEALKNANEELKRIDLLEQAQNDAIRVQHGAGTVDEANPSAAPVSAVVETHAPTGAEPAAGTHAPAAAAEHTTGHALSEKIKFEKDFGKIKYNKELLEHLNGKNILVGDKITSADKLTDFVFSDEKEKVMKKFGEKSMYGMMKSHEKAELLKGLTPERRKIFNEMIKAVPPGNHPEDSLNKWFVRVIYAMENVKKH
jgi:hypothetical protein